MPDTNKDDGTVTGPYLSFYENECRLSSRIDLGPIDGLTIPAGMLQEGDTIHIENGRVVIERRQYLFPHTP